MFVVLNGNTTLLISDDMKQAKDCFQQWKRVTNNSPEVKILGVDKSKVAKYKKTPNGNTGYPAAKYIDLEDLA